MVPADKKSDDNPWKEREPASMDRVEQASMDRVTLLFGLFGATATTFAVYRMRRSFNAMLDKLTRSPWRNATGSSQHGDGGFRREAWNRYNRRIQEDYEEEMERLERIRRMQSVFNRERNKRHKSYESWRENDPGADQYYQRDDWYWKTDTSYRNQRTNFRSTPRDSGNYTMSHHYSVLGLDRTRSKPYSEAEIKLAFREKAKEYHPDQNQDDKEASEAKFKEVMLSYEAIKLERKNGSCLYWKERP